MQSWEDNQKIVEKSTLLCFSTEFRDLRRTIISQKYVKYSNVSRTICKNCPSKTWEPWHFPRFCPYLSTHPSLKSGTPIPTKITFLKLTRQEVSCHKRFVCYLLNVSYDRTLKMGCFLVKSCQTIHKNT